jgi:1-acyl-sn-glycerol-3-phosphate acyltransferase
MKTLVHGAGEEVLRDAGSVGAQRSSGSLITSNISPWLLRVFTTYSRWYVGRHFNSVRVSQLGGPPRLEDVPIIIYANHASWWDPLICLLLQDRCFRDRRAFAPIDAKALDQYRFFSRLGFFGVPQNSVRGAAQFLKNSTEILAQPNTVLWLTPQGRFADARERPAQFKAGLGHLPRRIERAAFVPLALEYVFWEERKPEVLCRFGRAEIIGRNSEQLFRSLERFDASGRTPAPPAEVWTNHFERRLEATQGKLAVEAQRRQATAFHPILKSRSGVGLIYDTWRSARAAVTGRDFHREHGHL